MVEFSLCWDIENVTLGMDIDSLKEKGKELWELIVKLETEKYDLEEKVKRQDYDVSIAIKCNTLSGMVIHVCLLVERVEGETETTEQTEGHQAWFRS